MERERERAHCSTLGLKEAESTVGAETSEGSTASARTWRREKGREREREECRGCRR